jgi:transposase
LGMKLRKLTMVALAAGVLIARFHLGLLHAPVLLTPVLLRDLIRRRSPASASASSRRSSSHTSSSGVRRRRPRAAATRARLRPIRRARPRSAHRRWRLTVRCPASSSPSVGWSSSQENTEGEREHERKGGTAPALVFSEGVAGVAGDETMLLAP